MTPSPISTGLAALFALCLTSAAAHGQSRDEPIPYPEEGTPRTRRNTPVYSDPSRSRPAEAEIEEDDRDVKLRRLDDFVARRRNDLVFSRGVGPHRGICRRGAAMGPTRG